MRAVLLDGDNLKAAGSQSCQRRRRENQIKDRGTEQDDPQDRCGQGGQILLEQGHISSYCPSTFSRLIPTARQPGLGEPDDSTSPPPLASPASPAPICPSSRRSESTLKVGFSADSAAKSNGRFWPILGQELRKGGQLDWLSFR